MSRSNSIFVRSLRAYFASWKVFNPGFLETAVTVNLPNVKTVEMETWANEGEPTAEVRKNSARTPHADHALDIQEVSSAAMTCACHVCYDAENERVCGQGLVSTTLGVAETDVAAISCRPVSSSTVYIFMRENTTHETLRSQRI